MKRIIFWMVLVVATLVARADEVKVTRNVVDGRTSHIVSSEMDVLNNEGGDGSMVQLILFQANSSEDVPQVIFDLSGSGGIVTLGRMLIGDSKRVYDCSIAFADGEELLFPYAMLLSSSEICNDYFASLAVSFTCINSDEMTSNKHRFDGMSDEGRIKWVLKKLCRTNIKYLKVAGVKLDFVTLKSQEKFNEVCAKMGEIYNFSYYKGIYYTRPEVSYANIVAKTDVMRNGEMGMEVTMFLRVKNMKDRTGSCVLYFHHDDAQGLPLDDTNGLNRTNEGKVSFRVEFTPPYQSTDYNIFSFWVPYSELHLPRGTHKLKYYICAWEDKDELQMTGWNRVVVNL